MPLVIFEASKTGLRRARLALRRRGAYNPRTLGVAVSEADTCRTYVLPKLYAAGWTDEQIREQVTFTDGRIVPAGNSHARKAGGFDADGNPA